MAESGHQPDRGPALLALFIAFTVASGIFVALRLGIRFQRRLFGWDDAVITFAMVKIPRPVNLRMLIQHRLRRSV